MRLPNLRSDTACLVILLLHFNLSCGQPIRLSRTAEVGTSGGNLLYVNTQQRPTPPDFIQGQDEQITTDENMTDIGDTTSSPFIASNEEIPVVVETDNGNSHLVNPQMQMEVPASPALAPLQSEVDPPLFYPPRPVEQPKIRLPTHYSPPVRSKPYPGRRYNSNDRLLGATPFKPSMLGFPPISNTRENVGLQINWAAKIGRAHRSFYDFLLA